MGNIRVLLVDDDALVRTALSLLLSASADIEVVGEAPDGAVAVHEVGRLTPHVVLTDLQMPRMGGVEATAQITARFPRVRVVAVTTFGGLESVLPMLRAGASGYLLKDAPTEELVAAIRQVHGGTSALSPSVAGRLIASIREESVHAEPAGTSPTDLEPFTQRETEVLEHLALGRSNAEIAAETFVSEGTVKAHLGRMMAKWNVRDRVQLLIRAVRADLIRLR